MGGIFMSMRRSKLFYMSYTALFAALSCVTTAYVFHIPFGTSGGYIHIGDAIIYLAAALLPTPYAMMAGALGGALADLLTAPIWAPATFLIKMLITLPLTCKKEKIINTHNVIGTVFSGAVSILGYYIAECLIYGCIAAVIPSMLGNLIQAAASTVCFVIAGHALDRIHFKNHLNGSVR